MSLAFHLKLSLSSCDVTVHNNTDYLEEPGLVTLPMCKLNSDQCRWFRIFYSNHKLLFCPGHFKPMTRSHVCSPGFFQLLMSSVFTSLLVLLFCPKFVFKLWEICTFHSLALTIILPSLHCDGPKNVCSLAPSPFVVGLLSEDLTATLLTHGKRNPCLEKFYNSILFSKYRAVFNNTQIG